MGKGSNASKNKRAREDALKRKQSEKSGGGGAAGKAARLGAGNSLVCKICRNSFLKTVQKAQLEEHATNKHKAFTFAQCFPDYGKEPAATAGAGAGAGAGGGGGKGKGKKK